MSRRGFTLAEILVSLALGLIFFGTAAAATVSFIRNRHLDSAADAAVSYLRTAALRSMQGEGNSSHGVSFAGGKITLFRGASYSSRQSAYDSVWPLPSYVSVSGLSEVVFGKQSGAPSASGNVVITNGRKSVTLTVYPTGAVSTP